MDLGLRGKVALVAAASRGLGRAIAFELANEGANLVMCARGANALEAARDEIATSTGVGLHTVVADLSIRERDRRRRASRRWRHSVAWIFSSRTPAVRPPARSRSTLGHVGARSESHAAQRGRADARRAARHARTEVGARHQRHVDRREAAGRQSDPVEQRARRR